VIGKVRGSARDANDGGEEVRESSDGGGGFWGRTADEDFPTAEVVGSSQDTTFITHSTDSGDFLTGISRRYGVSFHVAILCAPSTGILLLNYRPRKFCPIPSIRQHSLTPPQSTPIPTLTSPHLTSPHPTPSPLQTPHSSTIHISGTTLTTTHSNTLNSRCRFRYSSSKRSKTRSSICRVGVE